MSEPARRWFWLITRVALGAIFIGASLYKIRSPGAFANEVYNYKLLPPAMINPVAISVPWLELFCGAALVAGVWTPGAGLLAVLMMLVFQFAVGSALARGLNISCGCFKSGGSSATWTGFARDSAILVLAVFVSIRAIARRSRP